VDSIATSPTCCCCSHAAKDEAKQFGLFDLHLDATMAIADLQLRQGQQDHARILLTTLEADATAHGFNLIGAQAADARRHQPLNSTLQKKLQD
jgi:hypothetical protein